VSKSSNEILGEEGEENDLLKMQGGSVSVKVEDEIQRRPAGERGAGVETVHIVEAARECQLEFFKRMPPSICQNCGAHNPVIKK
jgi:hypothetical protein